MARHILRKRKHDCHKTELNADKLPPQEAFKPFGMNQNALLILRRLWQAILYLRHPAPEILMSGTVTLFCWLVLMMMVPGATEHMQASLALCAGFAVYFGRRFALVLRHRSTILDSTGSKVVAALPAAVTVFAILWTQHVTLFQHGMTGILFVGAIYHGGAALLGQARSGDHWRLVDDEELRWTLSVSVGLFYAALAILNETVVRYVSVTDWLIWWAVFPIILHYGYTLTVQTACAATEPNN